MTASESSANSRRWVGQAEPGFRRTGYSGLGALEGRRGVAALEYRYLGRARPESGNVRQPTAADRLRAAKYAARLGCYGPMVRQCARGPGPGGGRGRSNRGTGPGAHIARHGPFALRRGTRAEPPRTGGTTGQMAPRGAEALACQAGGSVVAGRLLRDLRRNRFLDRIHCRTV